MLHHLSGAVYLTKLDHQTLSLSNQLSFSPLQAIPLTVCVYVCVYICVCACVWVHKHMLSEVCFDCVLFLGFVMGYVLQFGEITHKRICCYYYYFKC